MLLGVTELNRAYQTAGWPCLRSRAAPGSCELSDADSLFFCRPEARCPNWPLLIWWPPTEDPSKIFFFLNAFKLFQAFQIEIFNVSPFLHSWSDLSLWGWSGRWCGPARRGTRTARCRLADAPLGLSVPSSKHTHTFVYRWFISYLPYEDHFEKILTSDTFSGPPNLSISSSSVLRGSSFPSSAILLSSPCFISSNRAVEETFF